MKEYSELLKDPRWQKRRLEILERDNWSCQACGDTKSTLHVHHKWYQSGLDPWDYRGHSLITLCDHCHKYEHAIASVANETLIRSILGQKGVLSSTLVRFAEVIGAMDENQTKQLFGV